MMLISMGLISVAATLVHPNLLLIALFSLGTHSYVLYVHRVSPLA